MSLSEAVGLLQQSHISHALDAVTKAKKECLLAVKILNGLPQDPPNLALSRATMSYYEYLSRAKAHTTEKMIWLNSKLIDFHPPVLKFSEDFDSGDFPPPESFRETNPTMYLVPETIDASFEPVNVANWNRFESLANLYQDVLSNCSFVSSLLSLIDVDYPLLDLISPRGPSESYHVRLHFNGAQRLVTIDNTLPFFADHRGRHLTITSASDPSLLWPALIEKAHLKIMGSGYRFEGSNMANDTFLLTGYLPEIISLDNRLPREFDHLWHLHTEGKLTLGIGTRKLSKTLSAQLGLTSNHDYSIKAYKAGSLVIKNSWIENSAIEKRYIEVSEFNLFKHLYVNWKPSAKFKYESKRVIHFNPEKLLYEHTQTSLFNPTDKHQEVWALIERSLPNKHADQVIVVSIYKSNGDKLFTPNQYLSISDHKVTNNRIKLETFTMEPHQHYTLVITSNYPSFFTLTVHHNIASDFNTNIARFPFSDYLLKEDGEWNSNSSGGNWSMSTFMKNPQYSITVTKDTDILLGLFSLNNPCALVNFHLFHSEEEQFDHPLRDFDKTKLLFNESYNPELQSRKLHLKMGRYKIILSTYEQSQLAKYRLVANPSSTEAVNISKIHGTLGLFLDKTSFQWLGTNRHKLRFSTDDFNASVTFQLKHLNGQTDNETLSSYRPGVRGSVFAVDGRPVKVNEEWDDSLYGVFVDAKLDSPGQYILLVERLESGEGICSVSIGSSKKVYIDSAR